MHFRLFVLSPSSSSFVAVTGIGELARKSEHGSRGYTITPRGILAPFPTLIWWECGGKKNPHGDGKALLVLSSIGPVVANLTENAWNMAKATVWASSNHLKPTKGEEILFQRASDPTHDFQYFKSYISLFNTKLLLRTKVPPKNLRFGYKFWSILLERKL